MSFAASQVAVWMPPPLLPPRPSVSAAIVQHRIADAVVAWRLHLRDMFVSGLPSSRQLGACCDGMLLRFTALWSAEAKRTTSTTEIGAHSWLGEHIILSLPKVEGGGLPEGDIVIELCTCSATNLPLDVIGLAKVSIAEREGRVTRLELLAPALEYLRASVSFRFDIVGVTREQARREWGNEDIANSY